MSRFLCLVNLSNMGEVQKLLDVKLTVVTNKKFAIIVEFVMM